MDGAVGSQSGQGANRPGLLSGSSPASESPTRSGLAGRWARQALPSPPKPPPPDGGRSGPAGRRGGGRRVAHDLARVARELRGHQAGGASAAASEGPCSAPVARATTLNCGCPCRDAPEVRGSLVSPCGALGTTAGPECQPQPVHSEGARRRAYRSRAGRFFALLSRRLSSTAAQTPHRDWPSKAGRPQETRRPAARRRHPSRSATRRASLQGSQTAPSSGAGSFPQRVQAPAATRWRRRLASESLPP